MAVIRGKDVVESMKLRMQKDLAGLDYVPRLAIVRIGSRPDDISYEKAAIKRMEGIGIRVSSHNYAEDIENTEFVEEFKKINDDADVDGILLFRPLPPQLNISCIEDIIDPLKDIDGISGKNIAKVFSSKRDGFAPCTAKAVVEYLRFIGEDLVGKQAVIVGRSMVVGKPLSMLLLNENCTVSICHSKTKNLRELTRQADIVIACVGRAKMLDSSYISEFSIVIDVGINLDEEGNLCGDVDFESVEPVARLISPVPGGVGTVTTSVLAEHVIKASMLRRALI